MYNLSYNLVYIINGKVKQTLQTNISGMPLGNWLKNKAKDTGLYRAGLLQLRRIRL